MTIYRGARLVVSGPHVFKDNKILRPNKSLRIINHSPDGFEWGYGGSGPAQLALAILMEEFPGDDMQPFYQDFKWDIISKLPRSEWTLTSQEIQSWMIDARRMRSINT